jgi:hypothetical protein
MSACNNRGILTIGDVTRTAVDLERLGKHVSAQTNSRNDGRAVFSLRSVPRDYKKDRNERLSKLSFDTPASQDMSLGAEELSGELMDSVVMAVEDA